MKNIHQNPQNPSLDKILIYDDECPLCQAYSGAFVSMGFLKSENRIAFRTLQDESFGGKMDPIIAKNEIPLVDANGGETIYGTDALIEILSSKWAFFRIFQTNGLLRSISKNAYSFISYNRKIIVPSAPKTGIDCSPSVNIPWRITFIVLAFVGGNLLLQSSFKNFNLYGGWFILTSLFVVQCMLALLASRRKWLDYVGNLSLVWLIQGFLLKMIMLSETWFEGMYVLAPGLFIIVCFEHFRRAKMLSYGPIIQALWLLNQSIVWLWLWLLLFT